MKRDTLVNFIGMCVWVLIALCCTVTMFLNWGHIIFALAGWTFAWLCYVEKEYCTESVRDYFKRKRRA